jgi:hypothetical protein
MTGGANAYENRQCRLCGASTKAVFRRQLLRRHDVQYLQCDDCGLLQTEQPWWLEEAYRSPIAERDTGIVARNLELADITSCLLQALGHKHASCLDAAGGYGLFTRRMRDLGFDYYWWDLHTPNLLARGFEGDPAAGKFVVISAFEVLEHLTEPLAWLRTLRAQTGSSTIITSTELYRGALPPDDWWYYANDTGQHIAFYQRRTLEYIAAQLGLKLYSKRHIHVWTDRPINRMRFELLCRPAIAALCAPAARAGLRSRVWSDSERLAARNA